MTSQIETIIAKAMTASKAWPAPFEAGSAAEMTRAVLADLDAAGFVVVPKVPTEEMLKSGADAPLDADDPSYPDSYYLLGESPAPIWYAMLEARPK